MVMKLVRAIRKGWIKPKKLATEGQNAFYSLWNANDTVDPNRNYHVPAPKLKLPGHRESVRPPPEYLPLRASTSHKKWVPTR